MQLPEYNKDEERRRFLQEVARLKSLERFRTDGEFCKAVRQPASWLNELVNPKPGRTYSVTTKVLYYAYHIYHMDIWYVVLGVRIIDVNGPIPDIKELSKRGKLGPPTRRKRKEQTE